MSLGDRVASIVAFFRAGYPTWAPRTGYIPLLALLPRRVVDDEVTAIARGLSARKRRPINNVDIGVAITRITHEMPSLQDIERVQQRLASIGPSEGQPDNPSGGT